MVDSNDRGAGLRAVVAAVVGLGLLATACGSSSSGSSSSSSSSTATQPTSVATPDPSTSTSAPVDGPLIIVQSPSPEGDGIYLLGDDGTLGTPLAAGIGSTKHADWSPDGLTVVMANDSDGALWTVGLDGSEPKQLLACDDDCLALDFPAWSPDGTHIAYVRYEPPAGADGPPAASSIQVLDLATMTSVEAVRSVQPELVDVPRWSGDGTRLVFGIDIFDDQFNEIGSTIGVSTIGGEVQRLNDPTMFSYAPDWSAATDEIVFSVEGLRFRSDPEAPPTAWNLWVAKPDGSGVRQLTDVADGQHLFQPAWVGDGSTLLATLETAGDSASRRTVSIDVATGEITAISSVLTTHGRSTS